MLEASRLAISLQARPLLRELRELAGRARITLPERSTIELEERTPRRPGRRRGRPGRRWRVDAIGGATGRDLVRGDRRANRRRRPAGRTRSG